MIHRGLVKRTLRAVSRTRRVPWSLISVLNCIPRPYVLEQRSFDCSTYQDCTSEASKHTLASFHVTPNHFFRTNLVPTFGPPARSLARHFLAVPRKASLSHSLFPPDFLRRCPTFILYQCFSSEDPAGVRQGWSTLTPQLDLPPYSMYPCLRSANSVAPHHLKIHRLFSHRKVAGYAAF